jgi:hypothetical protein
LTSRVMLGWVDVPYPSILERIFSRAMYNSWSIRILFGRFDAIV